MLLNKRNISLLTRKSRFAIPGSTRANVVTHSTTKQVNGVDTVTLKVDKNIPIHTILKALGETIYAEDFLSLKIDNGNNFWKVHIRILPNAYSDEIEILKDIKKRMR